MLAASGGKSPRTAKRDKVAAPFTQCYDALLPYFKGIELKVYWVTKSHDHGKGAWPTQETIARESGVDDRTVRRALAALVSAGAVTRVKRGRGKSDLYHFPVIPADWTPANTGHHSPDAEVQDRTPVSSQDRTAVSTPDRTAVSDRRRPREKETKREGDRMDGTSASGDSTQSVPPAESFVEPGTVPALESVDYDQPLADQKQEHDAEALADHLERLRASALTKVPLTAAQRRHNVKTARLFLACDGRTLAEVTRLLDWAYQDSYWSGQIVSLYVLRDRYGAVLEDSLSRKPRPRKTTSHGQPVAIVKYQPRIDSFGPRTSIRLLMHGTPEEKARAAEREAEERAMDADPEYKRTWIELASSEEFDAEQPSLVHEEAERRWQPTMTAEGQNA